MQCCCKFSNNGVETDELPGNKIQSRSSSQSTNIPSLERVLLGEPLGEPWMAKTFLSFLKTERNEESLLFFEEVEAFKATKGIAKPPPPTLLVLPDESRKNDSQYCQELVNTFVKENAPRQVNISDSQRKKLLEDFEKAGENAGYSPEIFLEAQSEMKLLMQHDSWPRFMKKALSENVSQEDGVHRMKLGILNSLILVLLLGLFLGFKVPRWYFLLLSLQIMLTVQHFVTYKTKLCFRNAVIGIADEEGSVQARVVLVCPITKRNQRLRAKKLFLGVLVITFILTGLCFASTYVVEAIVGKQLYGSQSAFD